MNPAASDPSNHPAAAAPAASLAEGSRWLAWLGHEIVFGLFFIITGVRLMLKAGPFHGYALAFAGCLAGSLALIIWTQRQPSPLRWRIRLLYYPSVMGISFFLLEHVIPLLGAPGADGWLLQLDRVLLGETPSLTYTAWDSPWLNDLLMVGYLFFFYYLVFGPAYYCLRDLAQFRACIVGLFTTYGLGLLLYTIFPAGGPHLHMKFPEPLEGYIVIPLTLGIINAASNGADVFPSLHFGATLFLLVFDWWHRRGHFWFCLAPTLALWCAAVLLRFHYFVDLLGGLVVALIGIAAAGWHARRTNFPTPNA